MVIWETHPWIMKQIKHCMKMRNTGAKGAYYYVEIYRELSRMSGEAYHA